MVEQLWKDIQYGLKSLRHAPGFGGGRNGFRIRYLGPNYAWTPVEADGRGKGLLLASLLPARRATQVDPLTALHCE